jgi:hypothetical protein
MDQQHSLPRLEHVRAPRVGLGAFGIGIVTAFVAGAIAVSLVAGGYRALSSQVLRPVAAPAVPPLLSGPLYDDQGTPSWVERMVAEPALGSGLNFQDFGTSPQMCPTVAAAAPPFRPLIDDQGTPSRIGR